MLEFKKTPYALDFMADLPTAILLSLEPWTQRTFDAVAALHEAPQVCRIWSAMSAGGAKHYDWKVAQGICTKQSNWKVIQCLHAAIVLFLALSAAKRPYMYQAWLELYCYCALSAAIVLQLKHCCFATCLASLCLTCLVGLVSLSRLELLGDQRKI